jgi:hypothetical protein
MRLSSHKHKAKWFILSPASPTQSNDIKVAPQTSIQVKTQHKKTENIVK